MTHDSLAALAAAAGAAASAGRWQDAERLWNEVRAADPGNVQALFSLGVHAFQRGDAASALALLEQARQRAPRDPLIPLSISRVYRDRGDSQREWDALMATLAIDPYFLPALLGKGEWLQRQRRSRAAAAVFRDVLKVAPAESQWPAALRQRLAAAREAVGQDGEALTGFLQERIGAPRHGLDLAAQGRWDEAVSILAGRSKPYHAECHTLHVPRLPALTFYPREHFPWIAALEAQTAAIRGELDALLATHFQDFTPYIAYRPGDPVNQWGKLNHSRDWSTLHLYAHGEAVQENLARCPVTAAALAEIDSVQIDGLCPNAMFSALAPHTVIPPHTGETNARLVAHLPLKVPERCRFRVGFDSREWREGEVFVFDDTLEHEARNDSNELRVVLIFDVWNPLLSIEERAIVSALASAMKDYRTASD